ncbi:uncharacterized protein LOC133884180 [Phragmites australis]|uniref:uncharacterized protein LOC133884180 n=1 Tax=Phragmites australis TaxID=29695 RepID=UPI002D7A338F|nr:uncharacterized protein LOC133884180 [Phragmites australis]
MSEIVRRVPCEEDRVHMAVVCRSWHAALAKLDPPPPPLPCLLLPSDDLTRTYCILSGCRSHHQYHDQVGVRYFGSYDGGYIFVALDQTRRHRLVDLSTGGIHILPDVVCPRYHPSVQHVHNMVILAATLSSPPDDPDSVAAGIVTYQRDGDGPRHRRYAFWRMGAGVAFDTMPPHNPDPTDPNSAVEDVVYRNEAFHFLTHGEDIDVCAPAFAENVNMGAVVATTTRRFLPRDGGNDVFVRARYLVQSRGELLMVVRFTPHPQFPTSEFKVFRMIGPQMPDDDGGGGVFGYPWSWSQLDTLGGRMLFVGRGCSRSYEVASYPGFDNGVYFSDDRSFYDEEIMFRGVNERQYPCSDNGKWSEGPPPDAEHFFPEQGPSNHSSPAWLLI